MKTYAITVIAVLLLASSCASLEREDPTPGGPWKRCDPDDRVGCLCKDGSRNNSTDQSSCDNYGGFDRYICRFE